MNSPVTMGAVPQGVEPPYQAAVAAPVVGLDGTGLTHASTGSETIADMAIMAGDVGSNLALGTVAKNAGPIGSAVSAGFNLVGTSVKNSREIEQLLTLYRNTVAAQMGIAPEQVNEQDLRAAANQFPENKSLREELEQLDTRAVHNPVRALVTGTAAVLGGGAGALVGLPAAGVGGIATGLAGSVAASSAADKMMDGIIGKEEATPFTTLQQIEAKLQSGQGVSAVDMFAFHVAADKDLAVQIEGHMGDRFQDLPEEKQTRAMLRDHPALTELCKFEAYLINNKALPPASLMDERMQMAVRQQFEQMQAAMQQPTMRVQAQGSEVARLLQHPSQITVQRPQAGNYAQAITQQRSNDIPGQYLN